MVQADAKFSDLSALFLNCTLKPTGTPSNTAALIGVSTAILEANGVQADVLRPVDYHLAPGVRPDMTEHGFDRDDWPELRKKVLASDILVLATPIWLGEESSVCRRVIERLYSESGKENDRGQYIYYGRVGGCLITGNEDGLKHCGMSLLYALQHLGFCIPPQADAGWVGEAGPGRSYADEGSGGPSNAFTQRATTFMTWNLMNMARMIRDAGGIPPRGNSVEAWQDGARFDHPHPDTFTVETG
ncbi:MAG: NAD(P)H-dependent oxidoreductase [Gemmatimonadota bacterium]